MVSIPSVFCSPYRGTNVFVLYKEPHYPYPRTALERAPGDLRPRRGLQHAALMGKEPAIANGETASAVGCTAVCFEIRALGQFGEARNGAKPQAITSMVARAAGVDALAMK